VQSGNVLVDYSAASPTAPTVSITTRFSTDGGLTWSPATEGPGGDGTTGLAVTPGGTPHLYDWDSAADVPPAPMPVPVVFEITVDDGSTMGACTSSFEVDNSPTCAPTTCGDCNGDGLVTILDALVAAQHAAGLTMLTGLDFTNCNVIGLVEPDPGAMVDILDALTIAQSAAGLAVTLMCC